MTEPTSNRIQSSLRVALLGVVGLALSASAGCSTRTTPTDAGTAEDAPFMFMYDGGPDGGFDAGPMCGSGTIECSGECVRVVGDDQNCGSCGNACPAGVHCAVGECSCNEPKISCDGVCLDPSNDPLHCGSCDNACAEGEMCTGGTCILQCDDPNVICTHPGPDGSPIRVCSDLTTDDENCGTCNTRCGSGSVCMGGRCLCPTDWISCGRVCTDIQNDADNCGSCGITCGPGGVCEGGVCTTCGTDRTECSGRCLDVMTDPFNCGSCGRACAAGETCTGGLCDCIAGYMDCGAGCTDPDTDVHNCGGCGVDCGPGGVCTAGACTCAAGLTMCGSSCYDLRSDRANCSACGMACAAGEYCIMSACTLAPPTRYMQTTPAAGAVTYIDACAEPGHMSYLATTDDGSTRVPLPFPFRYFATDLPMGAMVNLCSNGWMGMDGATSSSLSGTVPSTTTPNAVIAPLWGDNVTGASGICVATLGTAPNRQWVVSWQGARYFGGTAGTLDFEVIFTEATQTIDFVYGPGHSGTNNRAVGLEDQTGMVGLNACPGGTGTCAPTSGTAIRFEPIP